MSRGPIIRAINVASPIFQRTWKRLPQYAKEEGQKAIAQLLLPPDQRPAKLHLHKLHLYRESIWTLHLTGDDKYKASFHIEEDTAVFRRAGLHDQVDDNPE